MEQNPADLQKKRWMLDFENPAFLPDWNFLKTLDSESSVFKKSAGWKETLDFENPELRSVQKIPLEIPAFQIEVLTSICKRWICKRWIEILLNIRIFEFSNY